MLRVFTTNDQYVTSEYTVNEYMHLHLPSYEPRVGVAQKGKTVGMLDVRLGKQKSDWYLE